jgi:hypothetical protein
LLGNRLFGAALEKSDKTIADSPAAAEARPRRRWVVPLVSVLSCLVLVVAIACAGAILPPGTWAGSTFLLTWFLIGLVALGALIGRARRREAWLGATLFGAGFMILAFGRFADDPWPRLPTVEFLDEIRVWLPPVASGLRAGAGSTTAANARIHETLNQHVPVHVRDETPLEDVLESIQKALRDANGKGIPTYVDPIGLQEADKTMTSTVRGIELDGIPLRTSLRLCLAQLDLAYRVQDGLLLITSEESNDPSLRAAAADAFQVVGHCILALIAATIGGLVAPFVCALARKPAG